MRKKLLSIILTTTLLLTGIFATGCGGQSDNGNSENKDSSKRTIVVATSANPRPYTYQDENGELTGYNIELTKALFEYLPQYNLEFEATELESCLTGLGAGRYQIVANNLGYKDERAELYIYQGPLNKSTKIIALRKGLTGINSLLDLAGYVTEGEPHIAETTYLEAYYDAHKELNKEDIHYTEKQPGAQYQDLYDGTVDFLLSSLESFKAYTEEFGYDFEYYVLSEKENEELRAGLELPYVYYCLSPDETQLAKDLTEAMKQYKESGKWGELTTKWFGEDVSPSLEDINYWDKVVR